MNCPLDLQFALRKIIIFGSIDYNKKRTMNAAFKEQTTVPLEDSSNSNESLNPAHNGYNPARQFVGHANSFSTDPNFATPSFPISVRTRAAANHNDNSALPVNPAFTPEYVTENAPDYASEYVSAYSGYASVQYPTTPNASFAVQQMPTQISDQMPVSAYDQVMPNVQNMPGIPDTQASTYPGYTPTWFPDLDAIDAQYDNQNANADVIPEDAWSTIDGPSIPLNDGTAIPLIDATSAYYPSGMPATSGNPPQSPGAPADSQASFPVPILCPTPAPTGRSYAKTQHKRHAALIAAFVILAIIAAAIAFFMLFPFDRSITLNGKSMEVKAHTTIQQIADTVSASYKPGDLLAIDGSTIEEGGGEKCSVTINGEKKTNLSDEINDGDVVVITDGDDITEDFTDITKETKPEVVFEGVGAMHLLQGVGVSGQETQRTGNISGIVQHLPEVESTPETMLKFNVDTGGDKVIALTFDDGPWDTYTAEILDILAANDAKATFFTIGNQIEKHSDVVKRAADEGHQVETHSWDHASGSGQGVNLGYMTEDEQRDEISKGIEVIKKVTGKDCGNVMRVPGGNMNEETARIISEFSRAEIGWNIDTEDWTRPGASAIEAKLLACKPGNIILMHDGGGDRSQTVAALQNALPALRQEGYRFITINEMLENYVDGQ